MSILLGIEWTLHGWPARRLWSPTWTTQNGATRTLPDCGGMIGSRGRLKSHQPLSTRCAICSCRAAMELVCDARSSHDLSGPCDDTTAPDRRRRGFSSHRRSSTRSEPEKHKPAAPSREAWAARNAGHVHRNIGLMGPGSAAAGRNPAEPFRSNTSPPLIGKAALRRTCRMSERGRNRNLNRQYPLIRAAGRGWQGMRTDPDELVLRPHARFETIRRPVHRPAARR
jgi:hypothetical protein